MVLSVGLGLGIWWQAQANTLLREEQARFRTQAAELARLRKGEAQHKASAMPSTELEKLQAEVDEATALRSHVEKLKAMQAQFAAGTVQTIAQRKAEPVWHNAGQATPADTLHTVIWTAVNGDVDTLVPMLAFDPESRVAAETLLASLSEENRAQYPTVEKLIATMISGRMSTDLNQAQVLEQTTESSDLVSTKFRLQRGAGAGKDTRDVIFRFQRNGSDWKLLVPKSAVAEYKRSLESH